MVPTGPLSAEAGASILAVSQPISSYLEERGGGFVYRLYRSIDVLRYPNRSLPLSYSSLPTSHVMSTSTTSMEEPPICLDIVGPAATYASL